MRLVADAIVDPECFADLAEQVGLVDKSTDKINPKVTCIIISS